MILLLNFSNLESVLIYNGACLVFAVQLLAFYCLRIRFLRDTSQGNEVEVYGTTPNVLQIMKYYTQNKKHSVTSDSHK